MQVEGRVGQITAAAGSVNPLRTNTEGALAVTPIGGKYYEQAEDESLFSVSNQAAVAVTAALATTYTGLLIGNAAGTGKNLILNRMTYAATVAIPAATSIGIMGGQMTALASTLTPKNRYLGGAASIAWCEDSCTIATPILLEAFAIAWAEATSAGTLGSPNVIDFDGSIIIPPGSFVAAYSTAALSASMLFSFMWHERAV